MRRMSHTLFVNLHLWQLFVSSMGGKLNTQNIAQNWAYYQGEKKGAVWSCFFTIRLSKSMRNILRAKCKIISL